MRKATKTIAILVLLGLVGVACSDSDDSSGTTAPVEVGAPTDPSVIAVSTAAVTPSTLATSAVGTTASTTSDSPSPTATGVAAGTAVAGIGALGDDGRCTGPFGQSTDDDVIVPSGATCTLEGARVGGNVKVAGGASLVARDVDVDGDIQGERHRDVTVTGGRVDGNIQLEDGGTAIVSGVAIDGDLQSTDNRGAQQFADNVIDGNLQCEGNEPAPTGGDNEVRGDKEDQCSAL